MAGNGLKRALQVAGLIATGLTLLGAGYGIAVRVHESDAAPTRNLARIEAVEETFNRRAKALEDNYSTLRARVRRLEQFTCDRFRIPNRRCEDWIERAMPLEEEP